MKKTTTIIGILILAGVIAVPVLAWGPRWGGGFHMMGNWDECPVFGGAYDRNLTNEQREQLDKLNREYFDETAELRNDLGAKDNELNGVLSAEKPDTEKARALQNEISDLRGKLDEMNLTYKLETRKIVPDQRLGNGNVDWYGPHMGTYGSMGGYGPEHCWN